MTDVTVRGLRLDDEAEVRAYRDIEAASRRELTPGFVPMPFPEYLAMVRAECPGEHIGHLVAERAGEVVGRADHALSTETNLRLAYVDVVVAPSHRGHGVGSALAEAVEACIPRERTELLANASVPPGDVAQHPSVRFALRRGWTVTSTLVVRSMPLPVDAALLDRLGAAAAAEAPGYRVETYVGGVPQRYREALGRLKGRIDVDAPTGDTDFEPAPLLPETYAAMLDQDAEAGRRRVEAVAVGPDGTVVGYSELLVPSVPGRHVSQKGTLVDHAHRGHRLGMAVKVASLRALAGLGDGWPAVVTGNEETNRWMVAINEALGFEVVAQQPVLRKVR